MLLIREILLLLCSSDMLSSSPGRPETQVVQYPEVSDSLLKVSRSIRQCLLDVCQGDKVCNTMYFNPDCVGQCHGLAEPHPVWTEIGSHSSGGRALYCLVRTTPIDSIMDLLLNTGQGTTRVVAEAACDRRNHMASILRDTFLHAKRLGLPVTMGLASAESTDEEVQGLLQDLYKSGLFLPHHQSRLDVVVPKIVKNSAFAADVRSDELFFQQLLDGDIMRSFQVPRTHIIGFERDAYLLKVIEEYWSSASHLEGCASLSALPFSVDKRDEDGTLVLDKLGTSELLIIDVGSDFVWEIEQLWSKPDLKNLRFIFMMNVNLPDHASSWLAPQLDMLGYSVLARGWDKDPKAHEAKNTPYPSLLEEREWVILATPWAFEEPR